jgi:hypothetical protein
MKAKSLQGDIHEFPLTDIIQLADLSKRSGGVHIQGKRGSQTLDGWIYFRDGKIIGSEIPGFSPLEAVYAFFTVSSGPFEWYDDAILEHPTINASNEIIIMEGIMRQDAWSEAEEQQKPSLAMIPRLVPNPSSGTTEINLEAEEWRVLTMVNGKNTVGQIAQRSGLGEVRTCEIIAQLLSNGLIEEREANPAEKVLPELERIAANAVGTNAEALAQDAYVRANITDPASATHQQIFAAITYLEQSIASLLDADRSKEIAHEMRSRTEELLG